MASTAMDTIDKTMEKTFPALGSLVEASAIRRTRKLMMDINSQSQRMPGICATSWEMGPAKVCSAAVEHTSSQTGHVEFLSGFHILSSSRQMLGGAPGLATKERHDGALSEQYTLTARPGVRRGYHGAVNQRDGNSTACRSAVCMGSRVKRDGYSCGNRGYRLHQGGTEVSEREPDNSAGGKLYTSMVTNHANKSIEMRVKHWLRASMFDKAFVSPSQVPEDEHEARDEEFLRALSSDIHPCEYSKSARP
ncbi:hypothetical protein EYC84_009413 [Monilinia fructicola]|uniref:Uncharacterized protein n=1 Tax=Monilinia fructicola TaxID=38448 RepID=A0A5M9JCE0_MONFR|nr:hypothetical protein EYC84_009413 [Monilinia fructicola]